MGGFVKCRLSYYMYLGVSLYSVTKPLSKDRKEDVFEVEPHIQVINHLGIGF
jgi:hypothetical protein